MISLPNGVRLLVANVRLVLPSIVISIASGGDFAGVTAGHRERLAQYPRLVSLLRTVADRHGADEILLAGDFNTPGGMPSLSPLQPMLRDAWREAGIGWGATMTADMPVSRIDQCWVSEGVEVIGATVRRATASDHRLLVVDMLVHPRPGVRSAAAALD